MRPPLKELVPRGRKLLTLRAMLMLAICLAYANSFQNGFHFDDFHTVVDNPAVRSLHNVPHFFMDATTFSVLPANRTYRPIVSASLAVDYALGRGYAPFWFHITTFVLFLLLIRLLHELYLLLPQRSFPSPTNRWISLIAAAWFGLHPAMAETVNYVIQRGDLYCTLGCVAALVIFARYRELRWTGVYLLPLVFALLSKPPAAVFPVLLFFYVFFFETGEKRLRSSLIAALPSAVVTGLLLWLQAAMTPKSFAPSILSPWQYRLTQPFVWLRYFGQLILPLHLDVDTDMTPLRSFDLCAFAGLLFLCAMGVVIGISARRRRLYPIAYGLIWFVVTQLPTSLYPLSEVENDHRMFFSFAGLMLAVVWAAWLLIERVSPSFSGTGWVSITALVVTLFACYGYGVHVRNRVWRDEESLWLDDVEKSPHNGRGLMIYGLTQMNKGAYAVALDYFTRALIFTPNYATLEINLGVVNGAMADEISGDNASLAVAAEMHFERAIALAPEDDATHAFYGRWLREHRRMPQAIAQLQTAVTLNPQRLMQRDELIQAYTETGDLSAALQTAQQTLALAPDDAVARRTLAQPPPAKTAAFWINLSLAQYQRAQFGESIDSARHALLSDPNSAEAYNNIGAASAELHRWDDAIEATQKAISLRPDFQLARNNLAWALAQKKLSRR